MTPRVCRTRSEGWSAMANDELVARLGQGVEAWNAWRRRDRAAPADLSGAALRALNLTKVDLAGADLRGADLRGTILTEAKLVEACLHGANLFKAVLEGADLRNADLRGAQFLNCAQLQTALNWQSTSRATDLDWRASVPTRERSHHTLLDQ